MLSDYLYELGSAMCGSLLVFIKFYWNVGSFVNTLSMSAFALPYQNCIVVADPLAHKAYHLYSLVLCRKSLPTSDL